MIIPSYMMETCYKPCNLKHTLSCFYYKPWNALSWRALSHHGNLLQQSINILVVHLHMSLLLSECPRIQFDYQVTIHHALHGIRSIYLFSFWFLHYVLVTFTDKYHQAKYTNTRVWSWFWQSRDFMESLERENS